MSPDTLTTLGQSAFDYLVEEAVRTVLPSSDITPCWVLTTLPEFYLDGWEELTDENQDEVIDELRDKVQESFSSDYDY